MKFIIITFFLILTASLNAREVTLRKKIPISQVNLTTPTNQLETYGGERFELDHLKAQRSININKKIIDQEDIELKNGQILYNSEIKFIITKEKIVLPTPSTAKAPHNPD